MKTKKEFLIFRQTQLREKMLELEAVRKQGLKYHNQCALVAIIGVVGFVLMLLSFQAIGDFFIQLMIIYVIGFVYALSHFTYLARKLNYKTRFKTELLAPTIAFISDELMYYPNRVVPVNNFKASRIFREKIFHYSGNDYVEGKIDKSAFHFSEVFVQMGDQGYNRRDYTFNFQGIFFIADFHKNFQGTTVLVPKKASTILKQLKKSIFNKHNNAVQLENSEIQRNFICYATDDVMARYILTASIQNAIARFKRNYPKDDVYFSFVHNHVFVGINHNKDLFYPTFRTSVFDDTSLTHYFEEIALVVSLIESLNLNTRIWTRK